MSDAAELAFNRATEAEPTNLRACAWDLTDGPFWLLVTRVRDGSFVWSWRPIRASFGWRVCSYGRSQTWAEMLRDSEQALRQSWDRWREAVILESANVDCRKVKS